MDKKMLKEEHNELQPRMVVPPKIPTLDKDSISGERKIRTENTRFSEFTRKLAIKDEFLFFDFMKTHVSTPEHARIIRELNEKGLPAEAEKMFEGANINFTENRPVLHVALRDENVLKKLVEPEIDIKLDKTKTMVYDELMKIKKLCDEINAGKLGHTGNIIKNIINIGIGGSDLGPRVVCEVLERYSNPDLQSYFASNVDPMEIKDIIKKVKLEESLFIVVSKTFTTQETLANAKIAIDLVTKSMGKTAIEKHFIAVTANYEEAKKTGIKTVFNMWDFVGGRYSLWSSAGISIALFLGFDNFLRMLYGASIYDNSFISDPSESIAALHALIEIYYGDLAYSTKCIIPYDYYMRNFYLHLQQMEMESNGKFATKKGFTSEQTGMIVWGGVGTNSQHSFFQLIHQGTHRILLEFLCPLTSDEETFFEHSHHDILVANCIAQSEALMVGKNDEDRHKNFIGDKPSITICYSKLTPEIIGALIAHYEHKVFVQGFYWGINSFDQFGVQLGKTLANKVLKALEGEDENEFSESTKNLIRMVKEAKFKE